MRREGAIKWEMRPLTLQDLEGCASQREEIKDLEEIVTELHEKLESARTSTLSDAPRASRRPKDTILTMIGAIMKLEDTYKQRLAGYYEHLRRVEIAIASLGKAEVRRIMRLKYIIGLTWEEVAKLTCYDERWCRELNRRGLKLLGIEKKRA